MLVDVLDDTFVHQQNVRSTRDIGVDGHWEDEFVCRASVNRNISSI